MNEVLFEVLKAVILLAIVLVVRYLIPWLKLQVEGTKNEWLVKWAE